VCTHGNKKQSVHRPNWGWKRAVAFAVSIKEFGIFVVVIAISQLHSIKTFWFLALRHNSWA
jgi:hypothetical protein